MQGGVSICNYRVVLDPSIPSYCDLRPKMPCDTEQRERPSSVAGTARELPCAVRPRERRAKTDDEPVITVSGRRRLAGCLRSSLPGPGREVERKRPQSNANLSLKVHQIASVLLCRDLPPSVTLCSYFRAI